MFLKIFTIPFNSLICEFDDSIMKDFLKDKEIISINEYHFVKNDTSYLTFVIKYSSLRSEFETHKDQISKEKTNNDESWKKLLAESDMSLFNMLRDWRAKRCKKDGVPPYIVLTNLQLATITKKRPQSVSELVLIDGIGQGKAQKYGAEILEISKVNIATSHGPDLVAAQIETITNTNQDNP